MSRVVNLDTGEILTFDPYSTRGVGLPDAYRWLDSVESQEIVEALPQIVRQFDSRLRALESR